MSFFSLLGDDDVEVLDDSEGQGVGGDGAAGCGGIWEEVVDLGGVSCVSSWSV